MAYEISEIKIIRKSFGLTQSEMAKKAGVSQSLIAKVESGTIDPSYSKVRKIFDFLDSLKKEHEMKAKDVMKKSIITISAAAELKDAIAKMKKHGISQIPVVRGSECIGLISETIILNSLLTKKGKTAGDVMDDAPPIISKNTSIDAVSELLRYTPLVIVSEKGKIEGIVTKSDILEKLNNYRRI